MVGFGRPLRVKLGIDVTSPDIHVGRGIPLQRMRPPKGNIPPTPAERSRLTQLVRHYVAEFSPVPPLPLETAP